LGAGLAWLGCIEAGSAIVNRRSTLGFWGRGGITCGGVDNPSSGRPLQSSSAPLQISAAGSTSPAHVPQPATPGARLVRVVAAAVDNRLDGAAVDPARLVCLLDHQRGGVLQGRAVGSDGTTERHDDADLDRRAAQAGRVRVAARLLDDLLASARGRFRCR